MKVSEELQQRADDLKTQNWVNHAPHEVGQVCLVARKTGQTNKRGPGVEIVLPEAAGLFLEWFLFKKVLYGFGFALTDWNDHQESVGPVIATLEEAAIFAKELDI